MSRKDERPVNHSERLARGPVGVSTLVGRLTRTALGARGMAGADLLAQWGTIVGPELAALATPATLRRERTGGSDGGTLILRVASGAAAMVLQLKGPQIVDRVNRYFGYRAVGRLQVVAGSTPKLAVRPPADPPLAPDALQEIERNVSCVLSPDLRAALTRLGTAVRRRRAAESQ